MRNGTYSPVTTAETKLSTFFEKFNLTNNLLGLKYKEKYPDINFSLPTDLGDTSLSPMDYRRSIDPLFDFVMEYTDNGIVNPGKEHEGEYFTGSFISRIFSDVPAMQQMNNATQLWHMDKFQWQENALPSSYSSTPCD